MSGKPKKINRQQVYQYIGLGMQWAAMLGIAVWGGIKLDALLKWEFPLCTVLLPLLALGIAFWQLLRSLQK